MSEALVTAAVLTYADLVDEVLAWHQARGRAGDVHRPRKRVDALRQRAIDHEAKKTTPRAPDWAYRAEHRLLIEELPRMLHPRAFDRLLAQLRSQRGREEVDPGVWSPLDHAAFADAMRLTLQHGRLALVDLQMALARYLSKPSHALILEMVRALEDVQKASMQLSPCFDVEQLTSEGERLATAVHSTFHPMVGKLIGDWVEALFRSKLEGIPIDALKPPTWFWHNKIPGLESWVPIWRELRYQQYGNRSDPRGTWFAPPLQKIYEARLAASEAAPTSDENRNAEEASRAPAAEKKGPTPERKRATEMEARAAEAQRLELARANQAREKAREVQERRARADELRVANERRRAAEVAEQSAQLEAQIRREKREQDLRDQRRRDHRLRIPRWQSKANKEQVLRFLRLHGIGPRDLPPHTRAAFRREFRR